jgi:C4-dicarboxylate transporter DctM subunit
MAWLLTAEQVAMDLAEWIKSVAHQPWQFLLMLNFTLLLLGIFIEPLPLRPAPLPAAREGVQRRSRPSRRDDREPGDRALHPAGGRHALRRGQARERRDRRDHARACPLMTATVLVLLLITYVPALSTTLVRLILN